MFGEMIGPDISVVLPVVVLLSGGSQLPTCARSVGSGSREYERGFHEGRADQRTAAGS